jgi:hypothetical protein
MSILRMGISDIRELNHMIAPGLNLGVTSTVAVNGYKEFNIFTVAVGRQGAVMQYQLCGSSNDVFCRLYDNNTTLFTDWERPIPKSEYVGKSLFDTVTGKPVWLKTINDYVKGVYTVTFGDLNVKHRFSITVTGVATISGTIAIRVDTNADIEVEVLDTDTVEDITGKIWDAIDLTEDWETTLLQEGALVCEKVVAGAVSVTQFVDTDNTGVTATIDILNEGAGSVSGNITLTVDGDDIVIPVVAGEYAEEIGFKLQTIGIVDWTVACSEAPNGEVVTLSCRFAGDHTITFDDTDSTGITAVIATVTEGSASVWVYADGSVSSYLPEEYRAS